jgi:hypothetical protein
MNQLILNRKASRMFLLLLFFWASTGVSQAQVEFEKSLPYDYFGSLESTKNFLFTMAQLNKTFDQSELVIMSFEGEELNRLQFQNRTRPTVTKCGMMGESTVFLMSTDDFIVIDADGKETSRHTLTFEEKIKGSKTIISDNGITVIQEVKIPKVGAALRVTQFSTTFEERWKFEKITEKGKYGIEQAVVSKNGELAVLYKKGLNADLGLCLLNSTGQEKAFVDLPKKTGPFSSYYFEFKQNGDLVLVSDYGSTSTEMFKGIPLGMSVITLDGINGAVKSDVVVDFLELQKKIGDKTTDDKPIYNQIAPALHLVDIVQIEGVSYLVCESYLSRDRKHNVPSTTPGNPGTDTYYTQMELLDYYLLNLDNPLENQKRIWKQPRTVELELGSFGNASSARTKMQQNRLFSYQGMYKGKLVSRGYGQMHNYYTLIDLNIGKEELNKRTYWGTPIGIDYNVMPQRKSYNVGFGSTFMEEYFVKEGMLAIEGSFTLYQYDAAVNSLNLAKIKF